ncbi:MAG TPA: cellulase family glycosylhydrolase [Thermoleophilaceae bacterium]
MAVLAVLAAPAAPASATTGCYAKEGALNGALVLQRASGCEQVAVSDNRLAIATSEGACLAKEGALSAPFVAQGTAVLNGSRCAEVTLAGNRIGIRTADGNCRVREGAVAGAQTWYTMWGPAVGTNRCTQLALTATRVGVMHEGGDCSVKENLFTTWYTMWGPGVGTNRCSELRIAGSRVGVRHEGGDCSVKADLFTTWYTMWGPGVSTNRCSELKLGASRVGVRHEGGDCSAKNDMFTPWMTQWGPGVGANKCTQLALSGSRAAVMHEGRDCGAKEPALNSQWVTQFSAGCRQVEVTDTRVAVRGDALPWSGAGTHPMWNYNPSDFNHELDLLQNAGASTMRFDVSWDGFEHTEGTWNQAYLDDVGAVVTQAHARGIRPVIVLIGTPPWAIQSGCPHDTSDPYGYTKCAPQDPTDYGAGAAKLASQPWAAHLLGLEVWNEPNETSSLISTDRARSAAQMTVATFDAVNTVRPELEIVTGSVLGGDEGFLEEMYDEGLGKKFDVVSMHPYNGNRSPRTPAPPAWNETQFTAWTTTIPRMHGKMAAHGDGSKDIWLTEFGWTTCPLPEPPGDIREWCVSEQTQAHHVSEAFGVLKELPYIGAAIAYELRDHDAWNVYEEHFGLVHEDFTAKPAYAALAAGMASTRPAP